MKFELMVDCGAFTRSGVIKLDDYIPFLRGNADHISTSIVLDMIPPQHGSRQETDASAQFGYENWRTMKGEGISSLMPVFHEGESFKWLDRYLADGASYIGIAPFRKDRARAIQWCRNCFTIIGNAARVHGLGLMSPALVNGFKWHSIDASTWGKRGGYGQIVVPHQNLDGTVDFLLPDYICVTDQSQHYEHLHFNYLPPSQQHFIKRYLREHLGMDFEQVARSKPSNRWRCWIVFLKEVERLTGIRIYFVTDMTPAQATILNECGVQHRLLSYDRLRHRPNYLKTYCA
jgi:hypothetical protein